MREYYYTRVVREKEEAKVGVTEMCRMEEIKKRQRLRKLVV